VISGTKEEVHIKRRKLQEGYISVSNPEWKLVAEEPYRGENLIRGREIPG
jgi:hypothetical protein